MRVLILSHYGMPHVGGVEVLVEKEIRALVNAGHEVVHITSTALGSGHTPVYPSSVRVVRVPASYYLERRRYLAYPLFSPDLLRVAWRWAGWADVVHSHGLIFLTSLVGLAVARLRGKPAIVTDHGGIQEYHTRVATIASRAAFETVGRVSARLATKVVAYNSRVLALMERLAGTDRKSLFLPYPVDPETFRPATDGERESARSRLGWSDGRPRVLFVGRLIPDKGVLHLLDAADPAFEIVFIGPGDPSILGLPRPGVEYLPPLPQRDLVPTYHAADLLVLPSSREAFPLVAREALACGLPALLAYDPGYEPYRGLPGLAFCERDPATIRAEILRILRNPSASRPDPTSLPAMQLAPPPDRWVERMYFGIARG